MNMNRKPRTKYRVHPHRSARKQLPYGTSDPGFDRFKGKCPVYLTVYENGLQAIPVTELLLTQGMGSCSFTCENNRIGNSGLTCIRHRPDHCLWQRKVSDRMPFFRSGSGGTPGRIFNLSEKEAVPPAAQAQTEPVIQTQSTTEPERFRQPQAMPEPEPVRQPQDIPEPESIRQPETTPQPEMIQQPKTILNQKQPGSHKPLIRK